MMVQFGFYLILSTIITLANCDGWSKMAAQQPAPSNTDVAVAGPIAGGWSGVSTNDPEKQAHINQLADFCCINVSSKSNSLYRLGVIQILSADQQVVAGLNYHIKFIAGPSTCRNGAPQENSQSCPVSTDGNSQRQTCTCTVWDQAWRHPRYKVTDASCQPSSSSGGNTTGTPDASTQCSMWSAFVNFAIQYNKTYTSKAEMVYKCGVFMENMKKAKLLQMYEKGTAKYGVTIFADMTEHEFVNTVLLKRWISAAQLRKAVPIEMMTLPDQWDWRVKGAVTPIKNQYLCGSCWAFAAVANMEGVWAVKKGKLWSLSEQQILDCTSNNDTCWGGLASDAYETVIKLGGLENENAYPYKAHRGECRFNQTLPKMYINDSIQLPSQNEQNMAQSLYVNGPLAISLNIAPLMLYTGGIARPPRIFCNPKWLNHAATVVGYGKEGDMAYWTIKNSFGEWWGEKGYLRLYRGGGTCGVDLEPITVVVE